MPNKVKSISPNISSFQQEDLVLLQKYPVNFVSQNNSPRACELAKVTRHKTSGFLKEQLRKKQNAQSSGLASGATRLEVLRV